LDTVYVEILKRSQDPEALRLGIVFSDQFPDDLKERARLAPSLEVLRSLLDEHRRHGVTA
jgi:hypothetical protein